MNFTPKIIVESVVTGILTLAVAGSTGSMAPSPTPAFAGQGASADRGYVQMNISAAEMQPAVTFEAARPSDYQTVTASSKKKSWWKRNAPIVGGAGGGALVGGLVGGGTGALIGGAVGGGGYLYKRHRKHRYLPSRLLPLIEHSFPAQLDGARLVRPGPTR